MKNPYRVRRIYEWKENELLVSITVIHEEVDCKIFHVGMTEDGERVFSGTPNELENELAKLGMIYDCMKEVVEIEKGMGFMHNN